MFVVRTHRQHTSLVIVIPKLLRQKLKLDPGDYVVLEAIEGADGVIMKKFVPGGKNHGRGKRGSGRKDRGGRS